MTLISVHMPKTAGTSFGLALQECFVDGFHSDYADGGLRLGVRERYAHAMTEAAKIDLVGMGGVACVHGHFMPLKYLLLSTRAELHFVTWLRDPVDRLVSHYQYWQENFDEELSEPHHRQVIEEGWTLEEFCLSERFRNVYSQYLWGFPLENFAFIGVTEFYETDSVEFGQKFLGKSPPSHRLNAVRDRLPDIDNAFAQEVREFHAADISLYQRAIALREERRAVLSQWQDWPVSGATYA